MLRPEVSPPKARLDLAIALLSILRHGPVSSSIPGAITPVNQWRTPLTAAAEMQTLVNEIHIAGLIYIHPASDMKVFVFEPSTFAQALQAVEGVVDDIEPPRLTDSYYPLSACFYITYGASMGTAVEAMDRHLSHRLQFTELDESDRLRLLAFAADTIADEAVRYFNHQIDLMSLPAVPDQHCARLREAAHKAADYMSLGRLYSQAWRAARAAAAKAQSLRLPNSPNMTTFAVNQFEGHVGNRANATNGNPYSELVLQLRFVADEAGGVWRSRTATADHRGL